MTLTITRPPHDPWWIAQEPVGEATMPRHLVSAAALATTSGVLRLAYFTARGPLAATKVRAVSGTTAAGATPSLARIGVYTVNAAGDHTLVINHSTGEIIAEHELDDARDYHPKKRQEALPEGRASVNDAPGHL